MAFFNIGVWPVRGEFLIMQAGRAWKVTAGRGARLLVYTSADERHAVFYLV